MTASNDDEFHTKLNAKMHAETEAFNQQKPDILSPSPVQMYALLYKPFDSPEILTFPDTVEGAEAPILNLFLLLAERIGEKGVKLTTTGNLPRNLCREVAQIHMGEEGYFEYTKHRGLNKETDFYDLHIVRLVAGLAKLTRKYHGKILLTKKAKKLLETGQHGTLYMHLFKSYATEYNWGYWDAFSEFRLIQQPFAYHLYVWQCIGDKMLESYHLTSFLLDVFPMIIDEAMESESEYIRSDPAGHIERCYNVRVLLRFGEFLGLLSLRSVKEKDKPYLTSHYEVRTKPLLSQVVVFT